MSYLSGLSSGNIVAGGNGYGMNQTQLYYPVGLYLDSLSNSLIIANHYTNSILRWVLGDNSWTLLAGDINGLTGNTSTQLFHPTDVKFDPMGNMYIADRDKHRIQLFMVGQSEGITIAGVSGISGNDSILMNKPWSVHLDNQLNLYIADSFNHRVQKFVRY
jgi:DNA-binding beta-propeller fold protein YncE